MTHFKLVSSQENNVHCTQTLFLKSRWSGNVQFGGKQLARDKVIRENFSPIFVYQRAITVLEIAFFSDVEKCKKLLPLSVKQTKQMLSLDNLIALIIIMLKRRLVLYNIK